MLSKHYPRTDALVPLGLRASFPHAGAEVSGVKRIRSRPGTVECEVLLRLEPDHFVRPDWELRFEGVEAARGALVG